MESDLDATAIGRKIARLMRDDRPALIALLRATPKEQWPLLADAYIRSIGVTEATNRQANVPGVMFVWEQITKEDHAGNRWSIRNRGPMGMLPCVRIVHKSTEQHERQRRHNKGREKDTAM